MRFITGHTVGKGKVSTSAGLQGAGVSFILNRGRTGGRRQKEHRVIKLLWSQVLSGYQKCDPLYHHLKNGQVGPSHYKKVVACGVASPLVTRCY
jgi:hypothetical protein